MHRVARRISTVAVALVATNVLVSCGGGGSSDVSGPATSVSVGDNTFEPQDITIAKGTVVEWTNNGKIQHNVVSAELTSLRVDKDDFNPGATYRYKFETPGRYLYFCSIHGTRNATGQHGFVTVTAS